MLALYDQKIFEYIFKNEIKRPYEYNRSHSYLLYLAWKSYFSSKSKKDILVLYSEIELDVNLNLFLGIFSLIHEIYDLHHIQEILFPIDFLNQDILLL